VFIAAVLLVLVVLAGLAIGREIVRSNYYVTEHDGTVSIMQGVQGSFLGLALQEPYLLGCLNARNELSLIRAGQSNDNLDCRMLGVNDMRPSERAQVIAGLPSGTLDEAIAQIEELAHSSVLPTCAPRTPAPTTTTTSPSPTPRMPETPANPGIPEGGSETPAPETPTTVTAPAPAPPAPAPPVPPPPGAPPPTSSPTPQPTVTVLPPPPPEPGTNCREVS
jgi:protein phosphatase